MVKSIIIFTGLVIFFFGAASTLASEQSAQNVGYQFNGRIYKLSPYKDIIRDQVIYDEKDFGDFPAMVDLVDIQTPVKNQGNRGSCAHFSATALLESAIKKHQGDSVNISEEYLIYYSKAVANQYPYTEGSQAYSNLSSYKRGGFLLEKDAPYQPSWFEKGLPCEGYKAESRNAPAYCYSHHRPSDQVMAKKINVSGLKIIYLRDSNSYSVVQEMATNGRPVVVGLPVNRNGWNASTGHCVHNEALRRECNQNPKVCGRHSVLLIGYDQEKKIFKFKNSWGHDWGKKGHGTIPFEVIDKYADWSMISAVVRKKINLPADYNQQQESKVKRVETVVEKEDDQLVAKLAGKITNVPNMVIYASAFVVYKKFGVTNDEVPTDQNVDLLTVPSLYQTEFGRYVRGTAYHMVDSEGSVSFDMQANPATMIIPDKIINFSFLSRKQAYLRVSLYSHDDIEGWKQLYRTYQDINQLL